MVCAECVRVAGRPGRIPLRGHARAEQILQTTALLTAKFEQPDENIQKWIPSFCLVRELGKLGTNWVSKTLAKTIDWEGYIWALN